MKKTLRSVHINSIEWKYAISNGNVRIYDPNTNQIKWRVKLSELPENKLDHDQHGYGSNATPSVIKQFIESNHE
jgi:hypothetical protein